MKKIILITTITFLTLTSCTKKPGIFSGYIYWEYNDYVGDKPDAGSKIKLYSITNKEIQFETTADASGNFKLEDIPPGEYFTIIQSKNTTDSPKYHLDNLLIHSKELKTIFGFDSSPFKKEIEEINKLQYTYLEILTDDDENKYGGLATQIEKYEKIESEIKEKSQYLISKLPGQFREKIGLHTGYDKSLKFINLEIKEGKTSTENVDFGTSYN